MKLWVVLDQIKDHYNRIEDHQRMIYYLAVHHLPGRSVWASVSGHTVQVEVLDILGTKRHPRARVKNPQSGKVYDLALEKIII